MRPAPILVATLVVCNFAQAQKPSAELPDHFEIGVDTFFDFGPPTDYYQLYVVRGSGSGIEVERIILTPEAYRCIAPAKIETSVARLNESMAELLGNKNPCSIPEKDLKPEKKRCKKCLVYSGINVTMRVQCGGSARLIRSDILDRDLFSAVPTTPQNTAWSTELLAKLDSASGPGVMDKSIFGVDEVAAPSPPNETDAMRELGSGSDDALFPDKSIRISDLYRDARSAPPFHPTVTLEPLSVSAATLVTPQYPHLSMLTRTEGKVIVDFEIDSVGIPKDVSILAGHPLLQPAVKDAVSKWKFSPTDNGEKLQATFRFALNCPE